MLILKSRALPSPLLMKLFLAHLTFNLLCSLVLTKLFFQELQGQTILLHLGAESWHELPGSYTSIKTISFAG